MEEELSSAAPSLVSTSLDELLFGDGEDTEPPYVIC